MPVVRPVRALGGRLAGLIAIALAAAACKPGGAPTATSPAPGEFGSTFLVSVSRPWGGTLTTADGRIRCGTLGSGDDLCDPVSVPWDGALTITATPDPRFRFVGWAADCGGEAPTCTLSLSPGRNADRWAAAAFAPLAAYEGTYFLVTVERPDHGLVTSEDGRIRCGSEPGATRCGPTLFPWDGTASLSAIPDSGFTFRGWSGDCAGVGACLLDTRTVASDKTLRARFTESTAPPDLGWDTGRWDETVWQ